MRPATPGQLLKYAGTPAFLVTDLLNIRYLTGLSLTAGVLLVAPRKFELFVDSRYREAAEKKTENFTVADLADLPAVMKKIRRCGCEAEHVTLYRESVWKKKFPNTKFVQTVGVFQGFRRQKEDEELRLLKRAHRMTKELLRRIPSALRGGITEETLARKLLLWALELGADGLSFDPIVAFGTHTSSPHHRPTSRSLQKGHMVQIDVGIKYKGYCADMSEVFFTVKPTKTEAQVYKTLSIAKDRAMKKAKAGVSTRELDQIARDVLKKAGIEQYFTHSLGHGVGLEIHEGVSISIKAPYAKLMKNEVITIEPGAYFPGKFGMRLEDMVFVQ